MVALCDCRWLCGFGVLCIIWRRTSNKVLGWSDEIVWRWSTESVGASAAARGGGRQLSWKGVGGGRREHGRTGVQACTEPR